jgi:hypothetical protein
MNIDVREQVRLPLRRCVELVVSGVQFRLFRASITVGIIALAVAFLMTMLTESFTAREVAGAVERRTAPRETFLFWVSRLSTPLTDQDLNKLLLRAELDADRAAELRAWGDLDDARLAELIDVARRRRTYLDFFAAQPEGTRRAMVGRARGVGIFDRLADAERLEAFEGKLSLSNRQFPTGIAQFRAFLQRWEATADLRRTVREGHRRAVEALDERFEGLRAVEILARGGEELSGRLEPLGFRMDRRELQQVRDQARLSLEAERLARLMTVRQVKARVADQTGTDQIADVTQQTLLREVRSRDGAEWLLSTIAELQDKRQRLADEAPRLAERVAELIETVEGLRDRVQELPLSAGERATVEKRLAEAEADLKAARRERDRAEEELRALQAAGPLLSGMDLSPERIVEVARRRLEQRRLAEVEATVAQAAVRGGVLGFSGRTVWLIVVSLMVCVVGIANAMLMSVTERFQEIATMKCLGATDGFIMINFILESCFQGLAGGVVGAVLGFGLGLVRSALKYGALSFSQLPGLDVLAAAGAAMGIGVTLSAMAAVYPAWVAARLAPMEAMRIE